MKIQKEEDGTLTISEVPMSQLISVLKVIRGANVTFSHLMPRSIKRRANFENFDQVIAFCKDVNVFIQRNLGLIPENEREVDNSELS